MKQIAGICFLLFLWLLPAFVLADVASSNNFILQSNVIDVGGGQSTSTGFNLRGSLGQPGQGISSSTSFILRGGFLYFPASTSHVISSGSGGGGGGGGGGGSGGGGGGGGTGIIGGGGNIGPPPIIPETSCGPDLSNDGRVDLVDLSILLAHYREVGASLGCYDLNQDASVSFEDLSIMMYYWTIA